MTRNWFWSSLAATVAAAAIVVAVTQRPASGFAQPAKDTKTPASVPVKAEQAGRDDMAVRSELPVAHVMLFSSGVGYFQREGSVEGNTRVDLSFPVTDVNDLLKSMVLQDRDGGHISTVSYDSNAPVERTLKSFAINLTGNPSFSQILNQARGEKVKVVLQQSPTNQGGTMTGTVMGLEQQHVAVGKETVEVDMLNIWCTEGLRSVKLSEVQRVRFLNPVMESELRKALETLALSHDIQKKAVSINFTGEGKRRVRVGYVVENPIWKTSYRLVLDKEKPYLQGWAVVENPTDEDWKDVRMTLVSGRPISFQMDLYQPLYVRRPVVEPELFASLRPQTYSGALQKEPDAAARDDRNADRLEESLKDAKKGDGKFEQQAQRQALRALEGRGEKGKDGELSLRKSGVDSAATASKLGSFFQYAIDKPVTLPRQKSAMLPIVTAPIDATRVSIYNEHIQAKFPLLGLKVKNTTGVHLNQGPITVFESANYAGDSRILDLQPNEERLLSYAIDLGTEVNVVPSSDNGKWTMVKAVKGILHTSSKLHETKTYTIVNRNDAERTVLIEHRVRNDFHLVDTDKPAETASDFYRFQVKVPAGKTEKQAVTKERVINQTVQLTNVDDNNMRFFMSTPVTSAKVKEGLEAAMKLRWALNKTQREIQELDRQLKAITDDQARMRANVKELPANSDAAKRLVEKFDKQETEIEKYRADIKRLQGTEFSQRKEFEDFLAGFSAE